MNRLQKIVLAGLMVCLPLCRVATPQAAALDGTSADWKTGKSRQEARTIEDQRYKDVVAGLDSRYRQIAAEWEKDAIACGNDSQTNKGCIQAAVRKRDRNLMLQRQIRVAASTTHQDRVSDINRFWEKASALKTR